MSAVLEIEALRVAYGTGSDVLRGVDLRLPPGETYGLVGESGCGKSTVAFAVQHHLDGGRITGGRINVAGRDLSTLSAVELRVLRGRGMAMVYQEPATALNPAMRIGAQLREVLLVAGRTGDGDAAIRDVLDRVRLPDPSALMRRWPHQLSGGQLQRVVIAMALLARPRLLILDEPTTGLDVTVEAEVAALVTDIAQQASDMGVLYISHNLGLIARVADRVGVMYAGQIVEEGAVRDILRDPGHPYTRGLLASLPGHRDTAKGGRLGSIPGQVPRPGSMPDGCSFAPRCHAAKSGLCDVTPGPDLLLRADGRKLRCLRADDLPAPPPRDTDLQRQARGSGTSDLVTVSGISRRFHTPKLFGGVAPSVTAADKVSFAIGAGEILALVGESGSGKSTLARVLIGLDVADDGRATGFGVDLARLPTGQRTPELMRAIRIIFQNPHETLNPAHSIGRILRRALKRSGRAHGPDAVAALLETVHLPSEMTARRAHQLSGGQKQRVAIARAFAGHPELIIADEPVSALDVSVQAAIVELLRDRQADENCAVLFISHDLELVRHIADKVVVLYRGCVVERGTTDAVFAAPTHPYTEALLAAVHPPDPNHSAPILGLRDEPPDAHAAELCPFLHRCHRRIAACETDPAPGHTRPGGHMILCHHAPDALNALQSETERD